jgi:hypothetical protein
MNSGILPSSGLLSGVRWFETDVSGLFINHIFKGQAAQSLNKEPIGIPETSFQTTLRLVITQKREAFSSTAAEA